MANVQPFDFNPGAGGSTSVKTGSYTIATGKYAIITAECFDGGTILFDAVVALKAETSTIVAVSESASYAVPAGHIFDGIVTFSTAGTLTVGGVTSGAVLSTDNSHPVKAGPGDTVAASGGNVLISGYARKITGNHPVTATFFGVKAGTAITVTGDTRYTVTDSLLPNFWPSELVMSFWIVWIVILICIKRIRRYFYKLFCH